MEIDWGEEGRKHSQDVIYEVRIKKYKKGTNLCVLILYSDTSVKLLPLRFLVSF